MSDENRQRLFWSFSRPLKYMGLTLDEWAVTFVLVIPGIIFLNTSRIKIGLILIIGGIILCYLFKKYKRLSGRFKIKSFMVAKGLKKAPLKYPNLLKKKRVGR